MGVIYSLHQCLVYIKHRFSSSGQVLLLYHTVICGGGDAWPDHWSNLHNNPFCAMSDSSSRTLRGRERRCMRDGGMCVCVWVGDEREGRDLSVDLWGVGVGKHGLSWITSHLQHCNEGRAPETAGLMISIDFPHSLCESQGLLTVKFDVSVRKERESRRSTVNHCLSSHVSSGVWLCNWLVFLHLPVCVHCMLVSSSLFHYNVCTSPVLVTSVRG